MVNYKLIHKSSGIVYNTKQEVLKSLRIGSVTLSKMIDSGQFQLQEKKNLKMCSVEGCYTKSSFNYEGENPLFCNNHKKDAMINILRLKCQEPNCKNRSVFNYECEKSKYCLEHKKDGMIIIEKNISKKILTKTEKYELDLIKKSENLVKTEKQIKKRAYKLCKSEGCETYGSFNFEGMKGRKFCLKHKLEGMVSREKRKCLHEDCEKKPSFNYEGEQPIYCKNHKLEDLDKFTFIKMFT